MYHLHVLYYLPKVEPQGLTVSHLHKTNRIAMNAGHFFKGCQFDREKFFLQVYTCVLT